jgi:hypothetical protein
MLLTYVTWLFRSLDGGLGFQNMVYGGKQVLCVSRIFIEEVGIEHRTCLFQSLGISHLVLLKGPFVDGEARVSKTTLQYCHALTIESPQGSLQCFRSGRD